MIEIWSTIPSSLAPNTCLNYCQNNPVTLINEVYCNV